MNVKELRDLIGRASHAQRWLQRMPVLFRVPALPLEAGDCLAVIAGFDADGSLVIEIDTTDVVLSG